MEDYTTILSEMDKELEDFSSKSQRLNAYEYEKEFRKITDKYDQKLFQASVGKIPKSKNKKNSIETSFGKINVKKKVIP
jgi:succinate dehydrogenase flavin-adding protein (antitoxin of CptAB toxin-antitoxin module)